MVTNQRKAEPRFTGGGMNLPRGRDSSNDKKTVTTKTDTGWYPVCWFRLTVHTSPAENKKPGMSTRQGHKNIKSILKFKCGIKKKASSITTKVSFSSSDDEVHTTYSNEEYNRRNFDFYRCYQT